MAAAAETSGHMSIEGNSIGTTEVGDILRGVLHNWEMHNGSTITIIPARSLGEDRDALSLSVSKQLENIPLVVSGFDNIDSKNASRAIPLSRNALPKSSNQIQPQYSLDQIKATVDRIVDSLVGGTNVPADVQLMDHGLDSLGASELSGKLSKELNMKVPSSLIFNYPSKKDIYEYIAEKLGIT